MSEKPTRIVIGVGSPHGDDQFGWTVIDELAMKGLDDVRIRKINNPVDLISELDDYSQVVLVDAASGLPPDRKIWKFDYAEPTQRATIQEIPSSGTHNVGLYVTLRMAESLGKRTDHVRLWIGNGRSFDAMTEMSQTTKASAQECADAIATELCDA